MHVRVARGNLTKEDRGVDAFVASSIAVIANRDPAVARPVSMW